MDHDPQGLLSIVTPQRRPLSPRDSTEMMVNNAPFNRASLVPIHIPSTDAEENPISIRTPLPPPRPLPHREQRNEQVGQINIRPPSPRDAVPELIHAAPPTVFVPPMSPPPQAPHVTRVVTADRPVITKRPSPIPRPTPSADPPPPPPPPRRRKRVPVPNYAAMTPEEQARHRAQFRIRFGMLRDAWPQFHIPEYGNETPLEQIHVEYYRYVQHIQVVKNMNQYKIILILGCMLLELFCSRTLGLNATGYAMSQISAISRYDDLLLELGEAHNTGGPSRYPVELRLLMMVGTNAIIFIGAQLLTSFMDGTAADDIMRGITRLFQATTPAGVPEPTTDAPRQAAGGFPLDGLMGVLNTFFNRGAGPQQEAPPTTPNYPRRPRYQD